MLAPGPTVISAILLATAGLSDVAPLPTQRFHFRIDECKVTALGPFRGGRDEPASATGRARGNAFLVERGGLSMLIAPIPMSVEDRASLSAGRAAPQAIVLTSLDALQTSALVENGKAVFPQSSIYVDRALVDDPRDLDEVQISARKVLATYHAIGRLHLIDPDAEVVPGLKIFVSPYRPRTESRVRVGCGPTALMILPAREVAFGSKGVGYDRRDERLPSSVASEAYLLALTDGAFPGIGRVYLGHDGYHWGTIEARSLSGAGRRRGEVFVEPSDEAPHQPVDAPVPKQTPARP
jgi:hypothetical protein